MKISEEQYEKISSCFPKHRREPKLSNIEALNAILYVLENGCKWRSLPSEFGNWHTIYVRMNRWATSGVLQRAFLKLQEMGVIAVEVKIMSLDSTCVKVHPDGMGALKKRGSNPLEERVVDGTRRFIWSPHLTKTL